MKQAITTEVARATGANATVSGPVTLKLLPRPRLQVNGLTLTRDGGALFLDAPAIKAEIDIASLFEGRWRLASATLVAPTLTLNLDRLGLVPAAAMRSTVDDALPGPLKLHVREGLLRTLSSSAAADLVATDIDVTASLPGRDDAFVFSGSASLRGTTGRFAGSVDHPARALLPEGSGSSLQIDSPLFALSATGLVSGGPQPAFNGHLAASSPTLPRLLRVLDGFPVSIGAHRAQISGDLVAKSHDVSLSNVQLRLDGGRFEGTLAFRRDAGRDLLQGTLATDMLDVDALIGDAANRQDLGAFYRKPLDAASFRTDVDMRVSASESRIGPLHLDDTAFAALLREGRLELTVDEARGYSGTLKARAIARLGRDGVETQADIALAHVDLGLLSDAIAGEERVSGQITGTAVLQGRGASLRDVVAALDGKGQVSIERGRLVGLSLGQALRRLGRKLPLDSEPPGQPTAFDRADWDFAVDHGVLRVPEGRLSAPGVQMRFVGRTDLPDGRIDVHAVAAQTDAGGAPLEGGPRMPFDMAGSWDRPVMLVRHGDLGVPSLSLPLFGPASPLP